MSIQSMFLFLLLLLIAYLAGSFSPSYFLGLLLKGSDLRNYGSGNLGMTNATRVLGKGAGVAVLLVDVLKGALPALLLHRGLSAEALSSLGGQLNAQLVFGIAAVLGHCFPFYLGWQGGKGVLTGLGVFLVIAPVALLIGLGVGLTLIASTRYVSIGSMLGTVTLAVATAVIYWPQGERMLVGAAVFTALFVIFTHRQNVARLLRGEEYQLGSGSKDEAEQSTEEPGSVAGAGERAREESQ